MPDSLDKICNATGIPRAEAISLWDEVKANSARLAACQRHEFQPLQPVISRRYQCAKCGGLVDSSAALWYGRGLQHAGTPDV